MPSDFLRVMGKVFLLTSLGMAAGIVFGGTGVAIGSVLGVLGAVTIGVGCLAASAPVHRRALEACYREEEPSIDQSIIKGEGQGPVVDEPLDAARKAEIAAEDEAVSRFVEELEAERSLATGAWRIH